MVLLLEHAHVYALTTFRYHYTYLVK